MVLSFIDMDPKLTTVVFGLIFCCLNGQEMNDYQNLYTDLFTNYNAELKPVSNQSADLAVYFSFVLMGINSFNEVDGIFSVVAILNFTWKDSSLTWQPSKYNGINTVSVSMETVWKPTVVLVNDAYSLDTVGSDKSFGVTIRHDGYVMWVPGGVLNAKCYANIWKFPFDIHACSLLFVTWDDTWSTFLEKAINPYDVNTFFVPNTDWNLETIKVEKSIQVPNISMEVGFQIKREPLYYNVLIFSPVAILSLLNPLVFILPNECGERLSFGMTILLSFVVFLTLASDAIPATSNPISFLIVFIILVIVASAIITVFNIVIIRLFNGNDAEINGCFKHVFVFFLRKKNKIMPLEEKMVKQKEVALALDKFCLIVSYMSIFILIFVYFLVLQC